EIGIMRLNCVEQLCNDRCHAFKMTWSHCTFKRICHLLHLDPGLIPLWIHALSRGHPNQVCAERLDQFQVAVQVARILREVLTGTELSRVDKDGDNHMLTFVSGAANEREMPFVQVSH